MPEYYSPHNWKNRGKITITYYPLWRNFSILRKLPYWVGDRVIFDIHFEKPGEKNSYATQVIHHKLNNVVIEEFNIEEIDNKIVGFPISQEGDIRFSLGMANYSFPSDELIMTSNVQSKDRWRLTIFITILSVVFGCCVGLVLAGLQVDPIWHIINPFWSN